MRRADFEQFVADISHAQKLMDGGQTEQAGVVLHQAAVKCPYGWTALANEYLQAGDHDTSAKLLVQAMSLVPESDTDVRSCCLSNLGMIASTKGDRESARKLFEQAIALEPNSPAVLNNLGLSAFWSGDTATAILYYHESLAKDPHFVDAEFHLSFALIKTGHWREGWRRYESRFRKVPAKLRKLYTNKPEWTGEPVDHLLVICEQGVGDTLMSVRMASVLAELVQRQTWITHPGTASLLNTIPHVRAVDTFEDVGNFDSHVQSMSLFHKLSITPETIPSKPYIPIPEPALNLTGKNIGIVWKGSGGHNHNNYRSSRLEDWTPLLDVPGVTIHSLQVGGEDEALLYPQIVVHEPPANWLDTARRMAAMDAIISVDTGPAHLAGAMGLKTFMLVDTSAEWRWMEHPTKTILYPSMTLVRAKKENDYRNQIQRTIPLL